jgi:hypothetical protein
VVLERRLQDRDQLDQPVAGEPDARERVDRHVRGGARLFADLLGRPDDRRSGHLPEREDELVRLMLGEEVVGKDDRLLLEVDPLQGAELLNGCANDIPADKPPRAGVKRRGAPQATAASCARWRAARTACVRVSMS